MGLSVQPADRTRCLGGNPSGSRRVAKGRYLINSPQQGLGYVANSASARKAAPTYQGTSVKRIRFSSTP